MLIFEVSALSCSSSFSKTNYLYHHWLTISIDAQIMKLYFLIELPSRKKVLAYSQSVERLKYSYGDCESDACEKNCLCTQLHNAKCIDYTISYQHWICSLQEMHVKSRLHVKLCNDASKRSENLTQASIE